MDPKVQTLFAAYVAGITQPVTGLCATLAGVRCGPDVHRLLDLDTDFEAGNGHPNAAGHLKLANALKGYIAPEPSTATLLLVGLVGMSLVSRR